MVFLSFGKNKLNNNDTTKTPATAFPLKISPTACGKQEKKFPEVWVKPTPIQKDRETMIIVRSSNTHSFNILIPSYMIEPNIITVQPPNTDCGIELNKAPNGGNKDARIKIIAPIKIVKRLITPVIVTKPTFCEKDVSGRQPKQPEIALEKPSTATEPCSSSVLISRFKAPVQTAVVAPVVSAADTKNTMAIVKKATAGGWKSFYKSKEKSGKKPQEKKDTGKKGGRFSNFQERSYDMNDLERKLVEKGES